MLYLERFGLEIEVIIFPTTSFRVVTNAFWNGNFSLVALLVAVLLKKRNE